MTENISCGNWVFVSPNSCQPEYNSLLEKLRPNQIPSQWVSVAERDLKAFRISDIRNFDQIVCEIITGLKEVSSKNIYINYDSYFFGVERNKKVTGMDYKLADWDDIGIADENTFIQNISALEMSIADFISNFVEAKFQKTYQDKLQALISYINS